jgi:hypothetical protein
VRWLVVDSGEFVVWTEGEDEALVIELARLRANFACALEPASENGARVTLGRVETDEVENVRRLLKERFG